MAYLSNFLAILLSYSLLSSSIFDNYFHENSAETATPPPLLLYQSCRLSLCLNANYSVMANRCLRVCILYFGVCIFKNRICIFQEGVCKIQRGFANFKRGLQTCCQELIFRDSCNRNPLLGFVSPKGGWTNKKPYLDVYHKNLISVKEDPQGIIPPVC